MRSPSTIAEVASALERAQAHAYPGREAVAVNEALRGWWVQRREPRERPELHLMSPSSDRH
jgi:hypothetical protein